MEPELCCIFLCTWTVPDPEDGRKQRGNLIVLAACHTGIVKTYVALIMKENLVVQSS